MAISAGWVSRYPPGGDNGQLSPLGFPIFSELCRLFVGLQCWHVGQELCLLCLHSRRIYDRTRVYTDMSLLVFGFEQGDHHS